MIKRILLILLIIFIAGISIYIRQEKNIPSIQPNDISTIVYPVPADVDTIWYCKIYHSNNTRLSADVDAIIMYRTEAFFQFGRGLRHFPVWRQYDKKFPK